LGTWEVTGLPNKLSKVWKSEQLTNKKKYSGKKRVQHRRICPDPPEPNPPNPNPPNPPEPIRPRWERIADDIIETGLNFLRTPYLFGARAGQTSVFDCSSFTQYVFGVNGILLPRTSRQQAQVGTFVSLENIRKGDLVFYTTPIRRSLDGFDKIGHVAIYAGNNKLLHTYENPHGVEVDSSIGFWRDYYVGARRVIE